MEAKICDRCKRIMEYNPSKVEGGGIYIMIEGDKEIGRKRVDLCPKCKDEFLNDFLDSKNEKIPFIMLNDYLENKKPEL